MRFPEKHRAFGIGMLALVIAVALFSLLAKFFVIHLPEIRAEIAIRNIEIGALEEEAQSVTAITTRIEEIERRIKLIGEVTSRRVYNARILERVMDAVTSQEFVWLELIRFSPDASKPGGFHHRLELTVNCSGANQAECQQKFSTLLTRLNAELIETAKKREPANARFEGAQLKSSTFGKAPAGTAAENAIVLKSEIAVPFEVTQNAANTK